MGHDSVRRAGSGFPPNSIIPTEFNAEIDDVVRQWFWRPAGSLGAER